MIAATTEEALTKAFVDYCLAANLARQLNNEAKSARHALYELEQSAAQADGLAQEAANHLIAAGRACGITGECD